MIALSDLICNYIVFIKRFLREKYVSLRILQISMAVTGSGSVGKCGRLSQPRWLVKTLSYSCTYLLTYLRI